MRRLFALAWLYDFTDLRPDRSRSENGGYLATKLQQEGTSKCRKTPNGLYRKSYDYIKAYSISPAYDLISEQYWRLKTDYG